MVHSPLGAVQHSVSICDISVQVDRCLIVWLAHLFARREKGGILIAIATVGEAVQ